MTHVEENLHVNINPSEPSPWDRIEGVVRCVVVEIEQGFREM